MAFSFDIRNCVWVAVGVLVTHYLVLLIDQVVGAMRRCFTPPPTPTSSADLPSQSTSSGLDKLDDILVAVTAQTDVMRELTQAVSQQREASTQLAETLQTLTESVQTLTEVSRQLHTMMDSRQGEWSWTAELQF